MNCDLHNSIPDWIIEYPETTAVFAELRLDTNCGGKSLEYVCLQKELSVRDVMKKLQNTISSVQDGTE
ncbi:hypothetical protein [Adhaeretor mobilis]|uniref:Uncharacterized protein n=1 Tax=Adhaeretor mobilis TaxID=1930276 RepID=A0A517MXK1_9BACT|nr:hypothetical protein [Adhaeretor mobilis]QDS99547.1 hypothetical protein HG15A2_28710 [Adhaeretor mobilis]